MILGATSLELLGVDSTEAGQSNQAAKSSPKSKTEPQKHSTGIKVEPGAQKPVIEAKGLSNKSEKSSKASQSAG
ncbi:hypothetical protein N7450_003029 [Penicillium hetheringtonii]|uniref:Uncharacterized protein n=1 Tax=Penicillium hetheringtonii TaxID=911720 RepID=A0AAD6DX07_9EURO|nr:hypothetical protein N7450_003029 [Penicillium hetheringtonii]